MKNQRELNLHYWVAIHEMVDTYNKEHGADVKPWECVRYCGDKEYFVDHPYFNIEIPSIYQFAVAILYDEQAGVHRPVFHSDTIYHVPDGERIIIGTGSVIKPNDSKYFSWHKPEQKRTFEINGVELPCPMKDDPERNFDEYATMCFNAKEFYFESLADKERWRHIFAKLLTEARDK